MNDQEYCPECGQENPRDAAFCATCGERFHTASPARAPPPAPPHYEPVETSLPLEPSRSPRKFNRRYIVYGVVGLFALLIVVSAANLSPQSVPVVSPSPTPTPTPNPTQQKVIDIGQFNPTYTPTSPPRSATVQRNI